MVEALYANEHTESDQPACSSLLGPLEQALTNDRIPSPKSRKETFPLLTDGATITPNPCSNFTDEKGLGIGGSNHFYSIRESMISDICEDWEDARDTGDPLPTDEALEVFFPLVRKLSRALEPPIDLKHAGFVEADGGISIVVQSIATGRRLNLRISRTGTNLQAVTVDESTQTCARQLSRKDYLYDLTELSRWLTGQA